MPTLYHFFGTKQGLVDAVIERGFDRYLAEKASMESSGDPIQDIRIGWDAHVAFGIANPASTASCTAPSVRGIRPPHRRDPTRSCER